MNFQEALEKVQSGEYVKRSSWEDGYVAHMPGMAYLWRIIIPTATAPQANAGNYLPLLEDFLASDWQVV